MAATLSTVGFGPRWKGLSAADAGPVAMAADNSPRTATTAATVQPIARPVARRSDRLREPGPDADGSAGGRRVPGGGTARAPMPEPPSLRPEKGETRGHSALDAVLSGKERTPRGRRERQASAPRTTTGQRETASGLSVETSPKCVKSRVPPRKSGAA
ncbi:hypothetical protein Mro03_72750 [Microbispora rosea subsp. rosea]|nr:hypothetical protein Mro03_72750 [Microbispora rosea subsp. rosea]